MTYYDQLIEASDYLKNRISDRPLTGLILGSGLSSIISTITWQDEISFNEIPHFPTSTVEGHSGKMLFGQIDGHPVCVLSGRHHYYEGHDLSVVTFPLRVMHQLGIERVVITNAAGGLNPDYHQGLIVAICDHINLFPDNPLRGLNDPRLGLRFPDLTKTYDADLIQKAMDIAKNEQIPMEKGVYLGLQGPSLETPAELEYMHRTGADLVGMSTVPEAIVAKQLELTTLAFSIVTNMCYPIENITETTHEGVLEVTQSAGKELFKIIRKLLV